ncbi:MAG: AsnC family transcriptional regulator [Alphaproteobacteria bacterium]
MMPASPVLDALDRRLLDDFQRDFPLTFSPFAVVADRLGTTEADVIARLDRLRTLGVIDRVGAAFRPNVAGVSTLAAMAVPEDRLAEVAARVNSHPEVNHNYEREHRLNLWFVVAAHARTRLDAVLGAIADETGLEVIELPLVESYHVDLGFPLSWN